MVQDTQHYIYSSFKITMSRNIESVASIFLDQIEEERDDLESVKQVKESWGSKQATPLSKEEDLDNGSSEIEDLISDIEDVTMIEYNDDAMRQANGDEMRVQDDLQQDSLADVFNLSGTLTSNFDTIEVTKS